jgi:8-oxo-dGTP diphosphatase
VRYNIKKHALGWTGGLMNKVNCIIILSKEKTKLLFCKRMNDPYMGLYNFVGGKIEEDEDSLNAAYRELYEETGITKLDTKLKPFMDFIWHMHNVCMEVYVGTLNKDVILVPEKHPLYWLSFDENFFDINVFAGEGNIGYMIEILKITPELYN